MSVTEGYWEKARGVTCSRCKREVWRQRDGLCLPCWNEVNEIELGLLPGTFPDADVSILFEIARKRKKSSFCPFWGVSRPFFGTKLDRALLSWTGGVSSFLKSLVS